MFQTIGFVHLVTVMDGPPSNLALAFGAGPLDISGEAKRCGWQLADEL